MKKLYLLFLLVIFTISFTFAQNKSIRGKIIYLGNGVKDAKIFLNGYEAQAMTTKADGDFVLAIPTELSNKPLKGITILSSGIKHIWEIPLEIMDKLLQIDVTKAIENHEKELKLQQKKEEIAKNNQKTEQKENTKENSKKDLVENEKQKNDKTEKNTDTEKTTEINKDTTQKVEKIEKLDFRKMVKERTKNQTEHLKTLYEEFFVNEIKPNTIQSDIENLNFKLQKEQELTFARNKIIQKEIQSIRQKIAGNPNMSQAQRDSLKSQIFELDKQFEANNKNYELFAITIEKELEALRTIAGIQENFLKKYRFSFYIFGGIILVLLCVVAFYFYTARLRLKQRNDLALLNKQIEEQKNQLLSKNEELNQQSEELKAQAELIQETNLTLKKTNDVLNNKNKNITESIESAKILQQSIFTSQKQWENILPNSFVFLKPKDIVSGDFYFLANQNDKIIVAVVDCTGHGVEGAFMTILGHSSLNQIIHFENTTNASQILTKLNKMIYQTLDFKQKSNVKSGMDMNILVFDKTQKTVQFAGAKNDGYYVENNELYILNATRKGIGSEENTIYEEINISLADKKIVFYLASDGLQDQFGMHKERLKEVKFMKSNFKNLLLQSHILNFISQKENIKNTFLNWKKDIVQTDDICIVGVKFN